MKYLILLTLILVLLSACTESIQIQPQICESDFSFTEPRNFSMGFSTWPFGPTASDVAETYTFIQNNADIYSEQIDDKIPWDSLIQTGQIPTEFAEEIKSKTRLEKTLLLSTTPLNSGRDNLAEELDGSKTSYTMNSDEIKNAYITWIDWLISEFNPQYLIIGMEINELYINSPELWSEYVDLMEHVRTEIKQKYPTILLSESMTIHNLLSNSHNEEYLLTMKEYATQFDYFSASYYPFFAGQKSKNEYQNGFDFVHEFTELPIAFSETTHLAEDLSVPLMLLNIKADQCQQNEFVEALFENAQEQDYKFIIFWTHKDYDALWKTFPLIVKDLGKIWRDTGLIDENDNKRPSYYTWQEVYEK